MMGCTLKRCVGQKELHFEMDQNFKPLFKSEAGAIWNNG